jgi:hypothetical protein
MDGSSPPCLSLQHLHEEFGVDGAAGTALEVAARSALFHAQAHVANFGCEFRPPGSAERGSGDDFHRLPAGGVVADHGTCLAKRLAFPEL